MENFLSELKVRISADSSKLKSELQKAKTAATDTAGGMSKGFMAANLQLAAAQQAIFSFIGAVTRLGQEFERNMALIWTLTDMNKTQINEMGVQILQLSAKYGQASAVMAKGLYDVVGSGIELQHSQAFLEVASRAAISGASNTATAVDALTSIVNSYQDMLGQANNQAERAAVAADILFQTVFYGKTTFEELAGGIGRIASVSSQVGISFEELGASLATLTAVGIKTDEAITSVRQIMVTVMEPTEQAANLAKELGLDFSSAALKAQGLQGFLKSVELATKGDSEALTTLFPNVRALAGVMALAGKSADRYNEILGELQNSAGATDSAFVKMEQTASQRFAVAKQTITNFGTAILQELVVPLGDLLQSSGMAAIGINNIGDAAKMTRTAIEFLGSMFLLVKSWVLGFAALTMQGLLKVDQASWALGRAMHDTWFWITSSIKKGLLEVVRVAEETARAVSDFTPVAASVTDQLEEWGVILAGDINVAQAEQNKLVQQYKRSVNEVTRERMEEIESWKQVAYEAELAAEKIAMGGDDEIEQTKKLTDAQKKYQDEKAKMVEQDLAGQRAIQFQTQQDARAQMAETTKYFEDQLQRRGEALKSSISSQLSTLEDLRKQWLEIDKAQRGQKEGFQERLASIVGAGLSEEGKQIQQIGLAKMYKKQATEAGSKGDFEEQIRLLEKQQNIFGTIAEQTGDVGMFQEFLKSQKQITQAFEAQKTANQQAQAQASKTITDLRAELNSLFVEAEKRLVIQVDTMEAKKQLEELRTAYTKIRTPYQDEGLLAKSELAPAPQVMEKSKIVGIKAGPTTALAPVTININEKVDKETVRKVILPEIKKAQRQSISVMDEDEEE